MHANANVQASAAAVPPPGRQGQSPETPCARTEGGLAHLNNAADFGIGANRRVQSASRTFLTHPAPTNAGGTRLGEMVTLRTISSYRSRPWASASPLARCRTSPLAAR